MRCYICDRIIDEPEFNSDHQDIEPCDACKAVIEDTLAGFGDLPAVPDDAPSDDIAPILEGLYPSSYDPFGVEP